MAHGHGVTGFWEFLPFPTAPFFTDFHTSDGIKKKQPIKSNLDSSDVALYVKHNGNTFVEISDIMMTTSLSTIMEADKLEL